MLTKGKAFFFAGRRHSRVGASLVAARAPSPPSSAGLATLLGPHQGVMPPSMAVLLATSDRSAQLCCCCVAELLSHSV